MNSQQQNLALSCFRLAVRPLLRFCLRHSIRLNDLIGVLKEELIAAASEELVSQGNKPSDSKVSVMTGVHRKDLSKLRVEGETPIKRESIVSRVIGAWRNDPRFSGPKGPHTLSEIGTSSEFTKLVSSISSDIAPYAVLYELERLGAVERSSRGLKLRSQSYVLPRGESQEGFTMLGEDLADLISTVESNISLPKAKRSLHLKTEFTEIPISSAEKVRSWLLQEGSRVHRRVEKILARYERLSKNSTETRIRVSYGSFANIDLGVKK
jgi:hypothetical protein